MSQNIFTYSRIYESAFQQEYERVQKFIQDIKNDLSGAPFFLNLFAPKNFGKTAFLDQVWGDYEGVLPTSLVHMGDFYKKDDKDIALRELLLHIIQDLDIRLSKRVTSLPPDYRDLTNEKQPELILNLVAGAKDFEKVALLLIDDYDSMPEEQRRWFQDHIFSPISQTKKVAVVLTSETELRFTENFDLRMYLECRELKGMKPEAIARAVPEYEMIAKEICSITGGLPFLIEVFIKQLEASQITTPVDLQARIQELTGNYYHYVEKQILADFDSNIKETMLVLALLRRFDVKVLKEILPNLLPESYKEYGTADYLDLIDRLRPWVQWRRQGGYTLNPAFRLILRGYVLTIQPDLYDRVNQAAEMLYREWLKKAYNEYYLIELLYHVWQRVEKTNGLFPAQDEICQAKVGDELLEYLEGDDGHRLDSMGLKTLFNSLEKDAELESCISENVKRKIQNLITQRNKKAHQGHNGLKPSPQLS